MKRFDLREFRRDKRVTQSELAELFQCKQNFISRIENGERTLPPEKLDILQDKYGDISKYYKEVSDTDEHMTINASPQEFINAGADAFTRQLVKMMNEKLIAPYSALLEKDMIIERLNREIGRLEMQLEDAKKRQCPSGWGCRLCRCRVTMEYRNGCFTTKKIPKNQ